MQRLLIFATLLAVCIGAHANTCVPLQAGATDQSVYVEFIDESTGIPNSSLAFNSSGIDLEYVRSGAAAVDITEATQTASGAHSDGGFVSVGHGRYRLDLPDAAVATGVPQVVIQGTITGYIMLPCVVALSPPVNVVNFGGSAGTFASGQPTVRLSPGTGTGQISLSSGAVTAGTVSDKTGYSLSSSQTFNLTGSITGNLSGSVGSVTGAVGSVTGDIGGIAPNGLTLDAFNVDTNPLFGIARRGTAQSATSTSLVFDSSASFGDDTVNGMTVMACGSTQGYCQSRSATDYVGSTDTATVDTWSVTPSGTITYFTYGTAPASGGGSAPSASEVAEAVATELGTGTQFTSIPWNSSWDAEVQSEATDALNAYDPPTNAEMTARTLASASYATATALQTVDDNVDAILVDTGTDIPAAVAVIDGIVDQLLIGVNISSINGATVTGDGSGTPFNVE